jgi:hypothetical protein
MYLRLATILLVSLTALLASAVDASVKSSSVDPTVVDASVNWNSSNLNSTIVACSDFDPTASANGNEDADFWERLRGLTQQTISDVFNYVATVCPATINSFKQSMDHVVSNTGKLRSKIESKARARGITLHEISEMLSKELEGVFKELKDEFPPPGEAEHHDDRDRIISGALKKVEDAVVRVSGVVGVSEADARAHLGDITPHLKHALVTIGDVAEQHPGIFDALMFFGATLVVPELWILKPIIKVFGIGPAGPIKDTYASSAQSRFFGRKVTKGSWFSILQSVAMGGLRPSGTAKKILGAISMGFGIFGRYLGEIRG